MGYGLGDSDGFEVGDIVGTSVGYGVGAFVGLSVGLADGVCVGRGEGTAVGNAVGAGVGRAVGNSVVGKNVGVFVVGNLGRREGNQPRSSNERYRYLTTNIKYKRLLDGKCNADQRAKE